jgi:hypothetical protein
VSVNVNHEALTLHSPIAHPREQSDLGGSVKAAWCGLRAKVSSEQILLHLYRR